MNKIQKQALWAAAGMGTLLAARAVFRKATAYELRNRVVLITGGSRGLGLVLARQLAAAGARLALCTRDSEELERAASELRGHGATVFTYPCDITDQAQVDWLVEAVQLQMGGIDVLINNAGIIQAGPLEEMQVEDFQAAMQTHFWGPLYTMMAVLPQMKAQQQGRIVNISSIGGKVSVPHLVPYSASKFALVGLSEGFRAELRKDNVLVTTFCPGLMRTGSARHAILKGQHRAEYAAFSLLDSNPLFSSSAESTARSIIDALRHGDAEVVTTLPAKALTLLHDLSPGLTSDLLGAVNRLLPGPGGIGKGHAKGYESTSALSPSPLTVLNEKAAVRNNEI